MPSPKKAQVALRQAIRLFLQTHFRLSDRSTRTYRAYECDLRQFLGHFKTGTRLDAIRPENIEEWVGSLKTRGLAAASIKRKVATVRCFFNDCTRRRLIDQSPFQPLRFRFPTDRQLPKALTLGEARAILREVRRGGKRPGRRKVTCIDAAFLARRNRAILEVLLSTAIRVGELTALRLTDVDTDDRVLRIRGKGGRQRPAFLVDHHALAALEAYLQAREQVPSEHNHVFLNAFGGPLSTQGVAHVLRAVAGRAGLQRHVTPHMLRHTAATLLLQNGADIRIVQEFLGHASISTTQRYAHVTAAHLRQALTRVHHGQLL
jgi:integrase/recombinase XerD